MTEIENLKTNYSKWKSTDDNSEWVERHYGKYKHIPYSQPGFEKEWIVFLKKYYPWVYQHQVVDCGYECEGDITLLLETAWLNRYVPRVKLEKVNHLMKTNMKCVKKVVPKEWWDVWFGQSSLLFKHCPGKIVDSDLDKLYMKTCSDNIVIEEIEERPELVEQDTTKKPIPDPRPKMKTDVGSKIPSFNQDLEKFDVSSKMMNFQKCLVKDCENLCINEHTFLCRHHMLCAMCENSRNTNRVGFLCEKSYAMVCEDCEKKISCHRNMFDQFITKKFQFPGEWKMRMVNWAIDKLHKTMQKNDDENMYKSINGHLIAKDYGDALLKCASNKGMPNAELLKLHRIYIFYDRDPFTNFETCTISEDVENRVVCNDNELAMYILEWYIHEKLEFVEEIKSE